MLMLYTVQSQQKIKKKESNHDIVMYNLLCKHYSKNNKNQPVIFLVPMPMSLTTKTNITYNMYNLLCKHYSKNNKKQPVIFLVPMPMSLTTKTNIT